jgi:hypothetical protein
MVSHGFGAHRTHRRIVSRIEPVQHNPDWQVVAQAQRLCQRLGDSDETRSGAQRSTLDPRFQHTPPHRIRIVVSVCPEIAQFTDPRHAIPLPDRAGDQE